MRWLLLFCIFALCASETYGQRRALVYYSLTSPDEVDPVSENPLSSSINSIQTGREELTAYHRADSVSGSAARRGYHKTTTPDYFKESLSQSDSSYTGKAPFVSPTKPSAVQTKGTENGPRNYDGDKIERAGTQEFPTPNRRDGDASLKDKRSSGSEAPSRITVRPDKRDHSETDRRSPNKGEVKADMDTNKGIPVREHDRRTNTQESRRQIAIQSSTSSAGFNTSVQEGSDRHRDEVPEKNHRPPTSTENSRGHRTTTRSTSDKGQIMTHSSTQRTPTGQRYDRAEHPAMGPESHDKKTPDWSSESRDPFKNVDERQKDSDGESGLRDKGYTKENEGEAKVKGDQTNPVRNKPTHLFIGEERRVEIPKSPDTYVDDFRGRAPDESTGRIGSDIDKTSSSGEGKAYAARPYGRDDDERSSSLENKDRETVYPRRQRDRYDERSYEEHPIKTSQNRRDKELNATHTTQDRSSGRSSRPRDSGYDEEYRDDGYESRQLMKDGEDITKTQTRIGGRPYSKTDSNVDRDRYDEDDRRYHRDYSDDRRDERVPINRDSSRRYRDEENRRYRDDMRRTYDDYESRDRYDSRYGTDAELTRSYAGSGSRRYEGEEGRRSQTEYDRPTRRYKNEDENIYNNTERYRDNYDGYRDDNRRSSGDSGSSRRYDESDAARRTRYDDEEYADKGSYSSRDSDQKYMRRDSEALSDQHDSPRYREDYGDSRYREESRIYGENSSKDKYDQERRRTFEEADNPRSSETRSETNFRRNDDYLNNDSRRVRGDAGYRNPYDEDTYYYNRTFPENADRYNVSDRPRRRTDEDALGYSASDNPKYTPRSSDGRRRDRDYEESPHSRRRADSDDIRKDTKITYDEDYYRGRADSYDERTYRSRGGDDDETRDRAKDYDSRDYRDRGVDLDARSYRGRGDSDVGDRYRDDTVVRDRVTDEEHRKLRPAGGRDKDYTDRRYEERYRDESSEGTYRYREEDERYKYEPSDDQDRKAEYRDQERRNRGTQRFLGDYDSSDRYSDIRRDEDDRRRSSDRTNRRDGYLADPGDYSNRNPDRLSTKVDTVRRGETKSEFSSNPYDEERRGDGRRSQTRDVQHDGRTSGTQYRSHSINPPPQPPSSESRPDAFEKGDFARGRRTSFYSEDGRTDSDRDERMKGSIDDRYLTRTSKADRSSTKQNVGQSQNSSSRREGIDTSRHRNMDEIETSRIPSDFVHTSDGKGSSYDRGGRRRLPDLQDHEVDRPVRRDESEYKPDDAAPRENRGRYRYTKSRGDREDFSRHPDEGSFAHGDENPSSETRSKDLDTNRRDTLKGEYGSSGPGTPIRNKEDSRIGETGHENKEEHYYSSRERGSQPDRRPGDPEFDGREKVPRDRDNRGRDDKGIYENGKHPLSSASQEETKFRDENVTRGRFDSPSRDIHVNKENLPVVAHPTPSARGQGSSISRSATPIPQSQDKDYIIRNTSGKINSDKIMGTPVNREKRFHYDDRHSTNSSSRTATVISDELSKRPLTTKEVIEAAYRHSDGPKEPREIIYPVYVPGSSNMTSPDVIRPSERRGITTPTKKKKKK